FIASATVRVRHNTGSDAVAVADWVAAFISDQLYSFPPRGQSGVFKQNCWLSTPFHKYGHVCDEGFWARTRRERRAYPSGVCKERATTSGPKTTAARRVASLFGSCFGTSRSQPHCGGCSLVVPRQNLKATLETW